jgi:hypothetical protein
VPGNDAHAVALEALIAAACADMRNRMAIEAAAAGDEVRGAAGDARHPPCTGRVTCR